jgi:hypothetical protein
MPLPALVAVSVAAGYKFSLRVHQLDTGLYSIDRIHAGSCFVAFMSGGRGHRKGCDITT